jgi:hypothetical protein
LELEQSVNSSWRNNRFCFQQITPYQNSPFLDNHLINFHQTGSNMIQYHMPMYFIHYWNVGSHSREEFPPNEPKALGRKFKKTVFCDSYLFFGTSTVTVILKRERERVM